MPWPPRRPQERAAAQARVTAVQASANAAQVRVNGAMELLGAFDQQRFTPDVWHLLGDKMNQLSQRYLAMALDVAKRMQRAYNFENDVARTIIKADYLSDTVKGMLAADALDAGRAVLHLRPDHRTTAKPQPVRQTVSLAQRYPFLFETQLRARGAWSSKPRLDDFDSVYPGTYAGRIEHVEVTVDGIVPARAERHADQLRHLALPGARTPGSPAATASSTGCRRARRWCCRTTTCAATRIIVDSDRRRRRVFEGAGLASSWTLELPKEINTLDYEAIVDVRLTFTYQARFDPDMRARGPGRTGRAPQANQRQRPYPLRWLFPDAFFPFYELGRCCRSASVAATSPRPRPIPRLPGSA